MPDTLGETFKERRRELGISLAEAEEQLHIRRRLLEALEDGDYSRLPDPGYVRGYVSTYARFLELDPPAMLAMYRAETGHGRFHQIELSGQAVKPLHEQHALPWRAAVAVVAGIALVSLLLWGALRIIRGPENPPPIPTQPPATSTPASGTGSKAATSAASSSATSTSGKTKSAEPEPFHFKVVVADGESSWLRVTVDDEIAYEGTLHGPDSRSYEATTSAALRVGRPDVVTVYRDGKTVDIEQKGGIGVLTMEAQPPSQ